mgnify:CR=1 FL=1
MPIKHNTLSDEVDLIADEQWDENHDISTLTLDEIGEGSTNKAFTSTLKTKLEAGVLTGNTLIAVLANNVSTAADTNPVDLTGMVFTFEANSKYILQFFGAVSPAANSTGEGFQINVSAAVTSVWHHHFHQSANTGALIGGTSVADDTSVSVSSGTPATGTWTTSGFGVLVTGANTGTAQLRFRAEVAAVTTCVAGSVWIVTKVA